MYTLINGRESLQLSVNDRGLLYGDGAFETIAVRGGSLILLKAHLTRLSKACNLLRIPFNEELLQSDLNLLFDKKILEGVCKIMLTRGEGGRGYKAASAMTPTRIVQFFESTHDAKLSQGINIGLSSHHLSSQCELAGVKHLNRLDQVLASFDITDGLCEVLCLDQQENVIEGSKSNLLVVKQGAISTPDLSRSGVKGIMLMALMEKFKSAGREVAINHITMDDIRTSDELIFCNSVFGVWPVLKLVENASVSSWSLGETGQQAIRFQDEIFSSKI